MGDQKRGDDAADHAPRPAQGDTDKPKPTPGKEDAPNYADRTDGGRAMSAEDLNSANDE